MNKKKESLMNSKNEKKKKSSDWKIKFISNEINQNQVFWVFLKISIFKLKPKKLGNEMNS